VIRALLDSNILVSAFVVAAGPSAELVSRREAGDFELCLSSDILAEIRDVLQRPRIRDRYGLSEEEIAGYVAALAARAHVVHAASPPQVVLADPKDDHVLEAARLAGAHVLVTGDSHLLALQEHLDVPIVPPARFLTDLMQRPGPAQPPPGGGDKPAAPAA